MPDRLTQPAPEPIHGHFAPGFDQVAERFAQQFRQGRHVGASVCVYHEGECVADLWGGLADRKKKTPWERDTRMVLFSVTKGFTAMAMHLLVDRGKMRWTDRVADHWPGFAQGGKSDITVATLMNHRAGLPFISKRLSMKDVTDPARHSNLLRAMEAEEPAWTPGSEQGYHAITYGLFVRELFECVAGQPLGEFLRREIFEPLDSDVRLGTPENYDALQAKLYQPSVGKRASRLLAARLLDPESAEARVGDALLERDSVGRKAFSNPLVGLRGLAVYNDVATRRAVLAWASATGTARGVARAYLPFCLGGKFGDRQYVRPETLAPVYQRLSWSQRDKVLQKPLGWSHGFLKEERHIFCPHPESFGHAGLGGALGWADPKARVSFGYVMNNLDWRIRSKRCLELCRAVYEAPPIVASVEYS